MDGTSNSDATLSMIRRALEKVSGREDILGYIQRLTAERDDLLKRQEHLTSLARLMEKTVSEADNLAVQIKADAQREADERVKAVLDEAAEKARVALEDARSKAVNEAENEVRSMKENAEKAIEEARAKVMAEAESEARAIKANAEKALSGALDEHKARLQEQVKQAAGRLYEQMLAQAEETKRRLEAFQGDLAALSASIPASVDQALATSAEAAPETAAGETDEPKSVFEPAQAEATVEAKPGAPEPVHYAKGEEELVDIVILPPRDKGAMESIRRFLERQEEVAAVNVEHMTDRTLIQVLLAQPFNVAERLSGLSEVERLQTVSDGATTKIQVVLSVHSEIERERDRLDFRANRIASKIRSGGD